MTTPNGMNQKAVVTGTELRLDTALLGLQTALPAGVTTINIGAQQMPVADAIKLVQSHAQPYKTGREARATLRQLSSTRKPRSQGDRRLLADLRAGLVCIFGRESEELVKFGFTPARPRPEPTIEQKARSAAKARETREKRHTLGSRQKRDLKATETPAISIPPSGPMQIGSANGSDANGSGTSSAPTTPTSTRQ